MAQLVRAPPCHGGGREFESHLGRFIRGRDVVFYPISKDGEFLWGLSSAGRAPALQAGGHRFEPCRPHSARNGKGLIPVIWKRSKYGWIPEWPKGADCKSVGDAFEGSNPSPPIYVDAGWSSLEARRAHNPKVAGSNPVPAILPR